MPSTEDPLFYNSTLLFSDDGIAAIAGATVGVVGVGGVGAVACEMLARLGVGTLRVADPDVYEAVNTNRQLFATTETLGRNKAACAAERVRAINPGCAATPFEEGIHLGNVEAFCRDADVLVCQCDREASKVLLHRAAKAAGVPVVSGGRASIHEHRWKVRAAVYDYRAEPDRPCYDEVFHPGMVAVPFDELTEDVLARYDDAVRKKDLGVFRDVALNSPELYASIPAAELAARLETTPRYNKRHVCAVQANTAGCLVATAALRLLLGGPKTTLEINLWEG